MKTRKMTRKPEPMSRLATLNGQYAAYALANSDEFVRVSDSAWARKPLLDNRNESGNDTDEANEFHFVA